MSLSLSCRGAPDLGVGGRVGMWRGLGGGGGAATMMSGVSRFDEFVDPVNVINFVLRGWMCSTVLPVMPESDLGITHPPWQAVVISMLPLASLMCDFV